MLIVWEGWRREPALAYHEIKKYRAYGCGLQPIIIHYGLRRISSCMYVIRKL